MGDEYIQLISSWPPEEENPPGEEEEDSDSSIEESSLNHVSQIANFPKKLKISFQEPTAQIALATWTRRNHQYLQQLRIPPNINSKAKLHYIAQTEDGQAFLRSKTNELEHRRSEFEEDCEFHHVLATYYDWLGENLAALESIERSLKLCHSDIPKSKIRSYLNSIQTLGTGDREKLWLFSKLKTEREMRMLGEQSTLDVALEVERVREEELSVGKFLGYYSYLRKAVVVTEVTPPTRQPWTLGHIRQVAGTRRVTVKTSIDHSTEWAGLEPVTEKTVAQFIDDNLPGHYLFDWSLPLNCPELAEEFTIPQYFKDDRLKKTSEGALYRNSWPSLFIGPKGTKSGLHIDAFGSHFWMYLVAGRKKWTFYQPEKAGLLNPVFVDSMDPVFRPADSVLQQLDYYHLVLEPGELLFVPAGSPHRVENLEDSIAVSGNFVNATNLPDFLSHVKVNGLQDPRAVDLLQEMLDLDLL